MSETKPHPKPSKTKWLCAFNRSKEKFSLAGGTHVMENGNIDSLAVWDECDSFRYDIHFCGVS